MSDETKGGDGGSEPGRVDGKGSGPEPASDLETDPRFPSGEWEGFFLQREIVPGRHGMELTLTFRKGSVHGEGRDRVGNFLIRGRYSVEDGKCHWTKRYLRKHDVAYVGYNEGKGIWGTWEVEIFRGGFQIWPKGMGDPTQRRLRATAPAGGGAEAPVSERPIIILEDSESATGAERESELEVVVGAAD